jgi:hypothetical protein
MHSHKRLWRKEVNITNVLGEEFNNLVLRSVINY